MSFQSISPIIGQAALSCTTTIPEFELGTKVVAAGNEYCYVYNLANSKLTTGVPTVIDTTNSSTSGFSVTLTLAASQTGEFAGVPQQTFATGTYGFIMTKGVSLIALDASELSMNQGDHLALGIDGGFVSALATLSTSPRYGFMLNSGVTTVGTGKGRIYGSVL